MALDLELDKDPELKLDQAMIVRYDRIHKTFDLELRACM